MSSSVSTDKSRGSISKKGPRLRKWVIVVAGILSTLLLFAFIRTQGRVNGQEFSPSHFQARTFSFFEIPILQIQITPIRRSGSSTPTARYIRQTAPIAKPKGPPQTWHLVYLSRGVSGTTPADAQLLMDHLTLHDGNDYFWQTWSIANPGRANILWPLIQRLAERELYILMPQLFELARAEQPAPVFAQQANLWLRNEYVGLVTDMRDAERAELADQLLREALADFPGDQALTQLKNKKPAATEES